MTYSQSMGKGAVAFTGHIDDFYVNASGNLEINYVFIGDDPEIKLRWEWFKINFVKYNGVTYGAQNKQLDPVLFDYKKTGFWNNVTLSQTIPTKAGWSQISRDIYGGDSYTSFTFKVDMEKWKLMSMEQRANEKEKWKSQLSPSRLTLNSINGNVIDDIFRAIKFRVADKSKNTSTTDFISDLEQDFDFTNQPNSEKEKQDNLVNKMEMIQSESSKIDDSENTPIETIILVEQEETSKESYTKPASKPKTIKIEKNTELIYTYEDVQKVNCNEKIKELQKARFNYESNRSEAIRYEIVRCNCLNGRLTRENGLKNNFLDRISKMREAYYLLKDRVNPEQVPNPVIEPDLSPVPKKCVWRYDR